MRIVVIGLGFEALFFGAQVKKEFALRLGGGEFDHSPVAQDVLMDLGLDPVHGVRHQAHALGEVKSFDGLHETDIAFLNQIGMGQAIAQVLARHAHHEPQVRHDQLTRRIEIVVVFQTTRKVLLLLQGEHGHFVHRRDVGVQMPQRRN